MQEVYLRDGIKSVLLSSMAAPSTKEHHCSRERHNVYVYICACGYDVILN